VDFLVFFCFIKPFFGEMGGKIYFPGLLGGHQRTNLEKHVRGHDVSGEGGGGGGGLCFGFSKFGGHRKQKKTRRR